MKKESNTENKSDPFATGPEPKHLCIGEYIHDQNIVDHHTLNNKNQIE